MLITGIALHDNIPFKSLTLFAFFKSKGRVTFVILIAICALTNYWSLKILTLQQNVPVIALCV